ncbi:hypothetical protein [Umezawaea sp. Da 62-37]|uniref:hypothetical protein n=1 Tax=Umezawaea sp. Da 62-37 TaxID=3075927 RepID=UPI0028F71E37|nr:hypothetical protein [Umezawaea sp. Da 62-37]WNV84957.1 hypothetical protein RM788_43515 [Umezawaea sp. Da 62-37]
MSTLVRDTLTDSTRTALAHIAVDALLDARPQVDMHDPTLAQAMRSGVAALHDSRVTAPPRQHAPPSSLPHQLAAHHAPLIVTRDGGWMNPRDL